MHSSSVRLVTWEGYLRRGGSVVLHKRDGRQLLAELLQHDHALQQGDVVHPGRTRGNTSIKIAAGRQFGWNFYSGKKK